MVDGNDSTTRRRNGGLSGTERQWPTIELGLALPPWERIDGSFCKAVFAEFVHITAFLFITIGTITSGCHEPNIGVAAGENPATAFAGATVLSDPVSCRLESSRVLTIAMAFGFSIAILVYSAATFSGGHLNPAVTAGLLVAKKITLQRAVCYWVAQILGAILGSSFVYAIDRSGWNAAGGGTNAINPGTSNAGAWFLEFLLTALLVFVVLAATDSKREAIGAHLPVLAPFAIGFTVFICHLVAIPLDGCSINPARSFGPAVVAGTWTDQWVFWVGPMSGGIFAAILYETSFRPTRKPILGANKVFSDSDEDTVKLPDYTGYRGAYQPPSGQTLADAEAGTHQPATEAALKG